MNWPDWYRIGGGRLTGVRGWWVQFGPLLFHLWARTRPNRGDPSYRDGGVTHACPRDGETVTPCCEQTPLALPPTDRMTADDALVACTAAEVYVLSAQVRGWTEMAVTIEEAKNVAQREVKWLRSVMLGIVTEGLREHAPSARRNPVDCGTCGLVWSCPGVRRYQAISDLLGLDP